MKQLEKHVVGENGISYTLDESGYYYPDLELPKGTNHNIGKYGRMRERYLMENKRYEWLQLYLKGELNQHLYEVDVECWDRVEQIVKQMAKVEGLTERMKSERQMYWVGMMNGFRSAAEEVVLKELVLG